MTTLLETYISEDFTFTNTHGRYLRTAEHDSLVYDRVRDAFFWNSRNLSGGLYTYLTKVRNMPAREASNLSRQQPTNFANIYVKEKEPIVVSPNLVDIFYERGKNNREYWYNKRGYTDATIDDFKLGYTGEWYTIPIFVDGEFRNFQLRRDEPEKASKSWYSGVGPLPFNFSTLDYTDWVVISEGPPDCIMLRQNDIPSVSQNNGAGYWNPDWNPKFARLKKIYIVYDNDEAGNKGSVKLCKYWGQRAKIYNFWDFDEGYDVTDFFKDGGTREDFIERLETLSKPDYMVGVSI